MESQGKKQRQKRAATQPSLFPGGEPENDGLATQSGPLIEQWPIPATWTWTMTGDVGEVKKGMVRTPRNRPGVYATKYLRAANITEGGLDLRDVLEMDFNPEEREIFALRSGDVVLSEASGSPDQVGKPALWRDELPLCCFQNTVLRFRPMGLSSEFALIVFQHLSENGLFAGVVHGVGIGHLGSERFAQFPFPLPPRKEQDRMVKEFAIHADGVRTALASLRSAKDKMFLQRLAILRRELHAEVDTDKDRPAVLPKGWSRGRLGDICDAVNGRAFKSSEWREAGLPIIRIQNLRDASAGFNYFDGVIEDRHVVEEGDLLFAWSGTPGTSFGAFLWHGPRGVLNQHIFKLTVDESRVNKEFLCLAINVKLDEYIDAAQGGGGLAHITRGQFLNSQVVLAPLKQQDGIVKAVKQQNDGLGEQEAVIDQNIQQARSLRQSLLLRAVQGTLAKQNEGDGTSAEHLAKIRSTRATYDEELAKRRIDLRKVAAIAGDQTLVRRDLGEVLRESGPLNTRELFRKAGYQEERPDDVEMFYHLLSKARKERRVAVDDGDDPEHTQLKAMAL